MIINKTRNTTIAGSCKLYRNIFSKATGLMFSKQKNIVFIFRKERIVSLHMLFVFFPIDVLFLDKNKKIVEIKKNLKPWGFYSPKKKAMYVVELKAGKSSSTSVGDKIGF